MNKKIVALMTVTCMTLSFALPSISQVNAAELDKSAKTKTELKLKDENVNPNFVINGEKEINKIANVGEVTFSYESEENAKEEFGKEYFYNKVGEKARSEKGDVIKIDESIEGVQSFEIWASSYDKADKFEHTTISVLVKNAKSIINIDGNVDGSAVVTNPKSITLGKDEKGTTKGVSLQWEIENADGKVITKGEDSQPVMAKVSALKAGEYSISSTVSEKVDENYGGGIVEATTSSSFKIADATKETSKATTSAETPKDPENATDNGNDGSSSEEKGEVEVKHIFRERDPNEPTGFKKGTVVTNTLKNPIGQSYTAKPKTEAEIEELNKKNSKITNEFKFDESMTKGEVSGKYTKEKQTVEFYYIKPASNTNTNNNNNNDAKENTSKNLPKAGAETTVAYLVLGSVVVGAGAYFLIDKKHFIV